MTLDITQKDFTPLTVLTDVTEVLKERGAVYGKFSNHAKIAQCLKAVVHSEMSWERLDPNMKEAIDMVFHKIARIVNGDPKYLDNWIDIQGYVKLVSDALSGDDH